MVNIRPIEVNEVHLLTELWLEFIQDPIGSDKRILPIEENVRKWMDFVKNLIEGGEGEVLVAVEDNEFVGYILYEFIRRKPLKTRYDCGLIYDLYVRPSWRRRGIGRGLLEKALERMKIKGTKCVQLYVLSTNTPAIKLYEKLGFREDLKRMTLFLKEDTRV